jgi:hypothetical protein
MIVMRSREPVAAVGQPEDPVTVDMRPGNPVTSITNKEDLAVVRPKGSQTKGVGRGVTLEKVLTAYGQITR